MISLRYKLAALRHWLHPKRHRYSKHDAVRVKLSFCGCEPVSVRCRILELRYWYFEPVYRVMVIESTELIWYGFKETVCESSLSLIPKKFVA